MGGGAGFIRERLCPCCKIQRNGGGGGGGWGGGDYVYGVKFIGGIMSMQIYVRLYKNDQGQGGGVVLWGGGGVGGVVHITCYSKTYIFYHCAYM